MTRQEEVEACIKTLQNRIPINANTIHTYSEGDTSLKYNCKYLIQDLEDLLGYINELEELNKD
jgi:hypothetical protein